MPADKHSRAEEIANTERDLRAARQELEDTINYENHWRQELERARLAETPFDRAGANMEAAKISYGLEQPRAAPALLQKVQLHERRLRALYTGNEDTSQLERTIVVLVEGAILGVVGNAAYDALKRILVKRGPSGESTPPLDHQSALLVARCAAFVRLRQAGLEVPAELEDLHVRSGQLLSTGTWDFELHHEPHRLIVSVPADYPTRRSAEINLRTGSEASSTLDGAPDS